MPIPSTIADLSKTAADNYPTGSEVIGANLDNYLRTHASFIRHFYSLATASITAAATVDVSAADGESVLITGEAEITSLGTGYVGCKRELRFDDNCTIANSSSIVCPGGEDIITADGDAYTFRCTGSGVWIYVCGSTSGSGNQLYTPVIANSNATLTSDHLNQKVEKNTGSVVTLTIPPGLGEEGDEILFVNNSASNLVIARGSGVALYRYGQNANVTIPAHRSMYVTLTTTSNTWQSN